MKKSKSNAAFIGVSVRAEGGGFVMPHVDPHGSFRDRVVSLDPSLNHAPQGRYGKHQSCRLRGHRIDRPMIGEPSAGTGHRKAMAKTGGDISYIERRNIQTRTVRGLTKQVYCCDVSWLIGFSLMDIQPHANRYRLGAAEAFMQ